MFGKIIIIELPNNMLNNRSDTMLTYQTRRYATGEQEDLVTMFREVLDWPGFDHAGTAVDYWEWKYLRRPHTGFNSCAVWTGGRPASHASWTATELVIDGRAARGGQLGDLYTHPDHRGLGLADRALTCVEADGTDLLFAFPSETGNQLLRKRGYLEAAVPFAHYQLIVDPARFFAGVKMGRFKRAAYETMLALRSPSSPFPGSVEEVHAFPDDAGEMARRFEEQFDLSVRHSTEYLNWRYADPTGGRSRLLVARRNGRTAGLAVLRLYGQDGARYIDLLDLIIDPGEPLAARGLLSAARALAVEEGVELIQAWLPRQHPLVGPLQRTGFLSHTPAPGERVLRLLYQPTGGAVGELLARPGLKAHLMLGDTDWV